MLEKTIDRSSNASWSTECFVSVCNRTGMRKSQKPEWAYIEGQGARGFMFYLLGDNIIVGEWYGYANASLIHKIDVTYRDLLETFNLSEKKYHYILDFSSTLGISFDVKDLVEGFFEKHIKNIITHPLVGVSRGLKSTIQAGMTYLDTDNKTGFYSNLQKAVDSIVFRVLKQTFNNGNIVHKSAWKYHNTLSGYKMIGQLIDDRIVYRKFSGKLKLADAQKSNKIGYDVVNSAIGNNIILIDDIAGVNTVFGKTMIEVTSFYSNIPSSVKKVIMVGSSFGNKMVNKLYVKFVSFGFTVDFADTTEDAYRMALKYTNDTSLRELNESNRANIRVNQLREVIGDMTWNLEDVNNQDLVGKDEFSVLFESLEVLKRDMLYAKYKFSENKEMVNLESTKTCADIKEELRAKMLEIEQ
ncbi:MAG: hypothetical protein KAG96_04185 [Ichthyobacteriaceae bacterium]|nr:hypothetical protein [Ichthyobacteriaceae bacterium]